MLRKLTLEFPDREVFVQEYHRNLANGGTFVPTGLALEPREVIEVELDLGFCERSVALQAEVVSSVGFSFGVAGTRKGVAVQFLMSADEVRDVLGGIAGISPSPPPRPDRAGPDRAEERLSASLAARIEWGELTLRGRTRNLSRTGTLIGIEGPPLPPDEAVRVTLVHPTSQESVSLEARVVRHVEVDGRVVATAVEFDVDEDAADVLEAELDELRAAAHAHQLGGIRGPIETLGCANLLQMFSSVSQSGFLSLTHGVEEGCLTLANGTLQHAATGRVGGIKALSRMLSWEEGQFWFVSEAPEEESDEDPMPIYGAVLEAVTQLDELSRIDRSSLPAGARVRREPDIEAPNPDDKTASLLLTLLEGVHDQDWTVGALLDACHAYDAEVYRALLELLDGGAIEVEA